MREYEISLWTQDDEFIDVLGFNGAYYANKLYNPQLEVSLDSVDTLSFSIPIVYKRHEDGQLIDNNGWYQKLVSSGALSNERKVKLIFNKSTLNTTGSTCKVYEFAIKEFTLKREDISVYCQISCNALSTMDLGKIGSKIVLDSDTVLNEEKELGELIDPTINYWLDKIFPNDGEGNWETGWSYDIQMDYSLDLIAGKLSSKCYEDNKIIGYDSESNPIYSDEPIEKKRFITIKDSNKYNITQTIAETFGVYVRYEYEYEDSNYPFKITKKKVVFYNNLIEDTNFYITYGNNEKSISKTCNSEDVCTKMYVTSLENEDADDGYISIATAPNNFNQDNFILNFDYYIDNGQLSIERQELIPTFESAIRELNADLADKSNEKYSQQNLITELEVKKASLEDQVAACAEVINDCNSKIEAIGSNLTTQILLETKVANIVKVNNTTSVKITFSRNGIIDNTNFALAKTDGTAITNGTKYYDSYGYITYVTFPLSSFETGTIIYSTYNYDVLSYYRTVLVTYETSYETYSSKLAEASDELDDAKEELEIIEEEYEELVEEKKDIINTFDKKMGYFLKEGTWNPSDYTSLSENVSSSLQLTTTYLDSTPRAGEDLAYYMVGSTATYYNYIIADSVLSSYSTTDITIYKENSITGLKDVYVCGAHFTIQYYKLGSTYYKVFLFNEDVKWNSNGADTFYCLDVSGTRTSLNSYFRNAYATSSYRGAVCYLRYTINDSNVFSTSITLSAAKALSDLETNPIELNEYYDYNISVNSAAKKVITFKNTNINLPTLPFHVKLDYKKDRSIEQLYYDALDVSQTSAFPTASYEVDFVLLKNACNAELSFVYTSANSAISKDINDKADLKLGSIVYINDSALQLRNVQGLVNKITLALEEPQSDKIIIQNYKTKFSDLFSKIVKSSETLQANLASYNRAANSILATGQISQNILQNSLNSNSLIIFSGIKSGVTYDDNGILCQNLTPYANGAYGRVLIKGGGIFLSNVIDSSGAPIYTAAVTPSGINANVLTAGRLDTEKINIYSGDQIRFSWLASGLFAYQADENGATLYDSFVRYNENGLLFQQSETKIVELGWDGLYIGAQNGSVELTGEEGLVMYDAPASSTNRGILLQIGRYTESNLTDYGFRMYRSEYNSQTGLNNYVPTLTTSSSGQLWLKDTLRVGQGDNYVGISGLGDNSSAPRIWAGDLQPSEAPFYVLQNGNLIASNASIRGQIDATSGTFSGTLYAQLGEIGGWIISTNSLTSYTSGSGISSTTERDENVFWAGGAENPAFAVTYGGVLSAVGARLSSANIDGTIIAQQGAILGDFNIGRVGSAQDNIYLGLIKGSLSDVEDRDTTIGIQYTNNFQVFQSGRLRATNAELSGSITSNLGNIGGWVISATGLTSNNEAIGLRSQNITVDGVVNTKRFFVKNLDEDRYVFYVDESGRLYGENAEIKGSIIVDSGYVSGELRVGTAASGILLHSGGSNSESYISSTQYASGNFGYGWKISQNGDASFSNISARGRIRSSVFEYQRISCVGGNLYVAPTVYMQSSSDEIIEIEIEEEENYIPEGEYYEITWPNNYSNTNSINGKDWLAGDEILFEGELLIDSNIRTYNSIIGYIKETPDTEITILIPISSIPDTLTEHSFYPGAIIIFYGRQGNRQGLYLTSSGDSLEEGPFLDVFDYNSDTTPPAVRLGNLAGIVDSNFYTEHLTGYGLYASNAYLRGQLMLPNAGITNQTEIKYPTDKDSPIRMWAGLPDTTGSYTMKDANFIVTEDGSLYAKQGIFEGIIKASNSEFSGTIKAAGIVINPNGSGYDPTLGSDHFFVGYKSEPETFDDYVLNIASNGLSIWESGFRVYSDYASGWREGDDTPSGDIDPIYGYDNTQAISGHLPMPVIMVADDGTGTDDAILDARFISYKQHILKMNSVDGTDYYHYKSIQLDDGIWLSEGNIDSTGGDTARNCEPLIFKDTLLRKNGLSLNNIEFGDLHSQILTINSVSGINLKGTIYINGLDADMIQGERNESLIINGITQLKNTEDILQNKLLLNEQEIVEAFDEDDVSIGFNVIIH